MKIVLFILLMFANTYSFKQIYSDYPDYKRYNLMIEGDTLYNYYFDKGYEPVLLNNNDLLLTDTLFYNSIMKINHYRGTVLRIVKQKLKINKTTEDTINLNKLTSQYYGLIDSSGNKLAIVHSFYNINSKVPSNKYISLIPKDSNSIGYVYNLMNRTQLAYNINI